MRARCLPVCATVISLLTPILILIGGAARPVAVAAQFTPPVPVEASGATFDTDGAHLAPGVTLRLAALGRGDALTPVDAVTPADNGTRVQYAHGEVTEWYLRAGGPGGGIEQGITLATRPAGDAPLALTIATPGSISLVDDNGEAATVILPHATDTGAQWRYDGLHVTDATGRVLPSRLTRPATGGIGITADDTDAVYPVTVDPFVQRQALSVSGASDFGSAVALSADGTTALVGAYSTSNGAGSAYLFTRGSSGYTLRSTLTGDSTSRNFGSSVALSGDGSIALVGAFITNNYAGTAYLFSRGPTGDYSQFGPTLAVAGSQWFGVSVALSTDSSTALVGASFTSVGSPSPNNAGTAYIFSRGSGSYALTATLSAAGSASFGSAVALSADGSIALIGARHTLDTGHAYLQGSAYVFTRSGANYTQSGGTLLGPASGGTNEFGYAVALSADGATALVGAYGAKTAYLYTRGSTGNYTQFGPTLAVGGSDGFGIAVALGANGAVALIGANNTNAGSGTAYTFLRGSGGYTLNQTFAVGGTTLFGNAAALTADGATALVGAPASSNSAYVFTAPTSIAVMPGSNYQHAAVTATFPTPLAAVVRDPNGATVSGATVTFAAPTAGASGTFACAGTCPTGTTVAPDGLSATALTDANGTATAPPFTANIAAGGYGVTATTGDVNNTPLAPATFSLTNTVGALASLTPRPGTTPQQTATGNTFAVPFAVTATDAYGNPIGAASITFTASTNGAGGTFAGGGTTATATTTISGIATAPAFTANNTPGSYTVTAAAGAVSTTFTVSNASGPPATLATNGGTTPQSATVGTTYAVPLSVTVRDSNANAVSGASVTFTAPSGTGPGGTFTGPTTTATVTTNATGVATAPPLTANGAVGAFAVSAVVNGVNTPVTFALTNTAGAFATLTARPGTTPQNTTVNSAFAPLAVAATDRYGNPLGGISVTFSVPPGGAGGIFAGTATVITDTNGIATAPAFTANAVAGNYTVTASATANGATATTPFALTNTAGAAAKITVESGSGQTASLGSAYPARLLARVFDASDNPAPGIAVTFAAPTGTNIPAASFSGSATATATTDSAGIATAPALTASGRPGNLTVTASVAGVTTPATFGLTDLVNSSTLTLSGFSPPTGPTTGGTLVTLSGTNLSGATAVSFDGIAGTGITVNGSGTTLTVTAPAHSAAGTVDISVTTGSGGSAQTATIHGYTYLTGGSIAPAPTSHPLPGSTSGPAPMAQPARRDAPGSGTGSAPAPNAVTAPPTAAAPPPTPNAEPERR